MEKNKVNYLVYVLFFCVAIAGIGCFYLGMHFGETNTTKNDDNTVKEKKNESKLSSEEIEKLGKEIFDTYKEIHNKYSNSSVINVILAYKDYESMDASSRLAVSYDFLNDSKITLLNPNLESDECFGDEGEYYNCFSYKIAKSDLEDNYYKIFGSDKKINAYSSFEADDENNQLVKYTLDGDNLNGSKYNPVGESEYYGYYTKYDSAKINDDNLEIYVKFLGFHEMPDTLDESTNTGIFSDVKFQNKIKSFLDYEELETESFKEDDLFNKYGDKAGKYKLLFKQDTNNNWYWLSSTEVKALENR